MADPLRGAIDGALPKFGYLLIAWVKLYYRHRAARLEAGGTAREPVACPRVSQADVRASGLM
jgi:hypothetical protein